MSRIFIWVVCIVLSSSISAQKLYQLGESIFETDYLPKTIILKVKPGFKANCFTDKIEHPLFNELGRSIGVVNLHKKFPLDQSPEKEVNSAGQAYADLSQIYELRYAADISIEKALNKLLSSGILMYAEPHFIPQLVYSPTDPLATPSGQYHLQTINAFSAWDLNKGDSAIVIGITDTGTDPTHPDLFNNIKRNYADVPDGIDNDGDGYIDNYMGWDVGMNDNDPTWQANAHGVHVSGIAGATTDNTVGIAGVGFNCKSLPVKIGNSGGVLIAAYEGIKYAADHGCHIINCSWGGGGASQYGQDIITYATINKNCLVIAAAGNNGAEGDFYPAAYNYVMAVANTSSNDVKHGTSNYGYFVDVCAPGDNIYSTWPGGSYSNLTGTSMSSPVVAGAAGVVKKQFPSYSGLQIAERLKETSDDIYALNTSYTNKLGAGRINLYRALTDPSGPSVVMADKIISDHNDESFVTGDTLFISGTFINYLAATSALNVTVTSLSAYATALDNTTSLGALNTMASTTNSLDPFSFKLIGAVPINQTINFEVLMQDGSYQVKQFFSVVVNVDYINITVNDAYTTATSKGKIGYNQNAQLQGLGFRYKDVDLLFEAGLMIGCDSTRVSDCVRGNNVSIADTDFGTVNRIVRQIPSITSDFDTKAKMNDYAAPNTLNVEVEQNTFAWSSNPNKQFVIWEYKIKNTHATDTLKNLYAGIFADWDIDGGTFGQNRSAYHAGTKMGYCFYTGANGKYGGIKLLTSTAPASFYAIDNVSGGNGGVDISSGFDTKEKYKTLSTQRLSAGVAGNGSDNANVMSTGPLQLIPGQLVTVAFAILGADSLSSLVNAANQAQIKYSGVVTGLSDTKLNSDEVLVFPIPAKNSINISQPKKTITAYEIYTMNGQLIDKGQIESTIHRIDVTAYSKGMYLIKLLGEEKSFYKKIFIE